MLLYNFVFILPLRGTIRKKNHDLWSRGVLSKNGRDSRFCEKIVATTYISSTHAKGQMKPKSRLASRRFFQKKKKPTDKFDLFALKNKKQTQQIGPFV